ncbi:MAG TPA: type II toxin-antitoxin system RelE/ParE family toxin [Vineibacter sp.]|nr:type II toxin-antitoxin system RelE/ParE family toxin [Vineibacter sp.]
MKTYRVSFRPEARSDLQNIYQIIAADSPTRAAAYIRRIHDACAGLRDMPFRGRARNDLLPGLRVLPFERRIIIAYRIEHDRVRVVGVFYGGRDYETLLRDHGGDDG